MAHLMFHELQEKVAYWAAQKGILEHSKPSIQLLKAMSELGELADAEIKGDRAGCIDGLGDVLVCLIIYAHMNGLDPVECLEEAWMEIKDRQGRMSAAGAFVKQAIKGGKK